MTESAPIAATASKPVRIGEHVVDLRWAKRSCKHCHGTGVYGTIVKGKERQTIVCGCVRKEHERRQAVMAAEKRAVHVG